MTYDLVVQTGTALTPDETRQNVSVAFSDGVIAAVAPTDEVDAADATTLTFPDGTAVPGFVDTHTHGYGGDDATAASAEAYVGIAESVTRHGVTTVLPTTMSATRSTLADAARAFADAARREHDGAALAGLHLEGPHLNPDRAGAQDASVFRRPDPDELDALLGLADGAIRRVTIAPELPGAGEYVRRATEADVVVSAGHTDADYEAATAGFDAGVSMTTHLFNGMRPFHHRAPGVLGAALTRDDVAVEVIADMHHLHPAAIDLAVRAVGVENAVLVTDAVPVTGLGDGEYRLGGRDIVVEDGVCTLREENRLAGSTLTMDTAVQNLRNEVGYPLADAARMASTNPAPAVGLSDRGRLREGYRGDVAVLDADGEVVATVVEGTVAYRRGDAGES